MTLRFWVSVRPGPIPPILISGTATFWSPTGTVRFLYVLLNLNWNVMSSRASPSLSTWISYRASGSSVKKFGPP